MSKLSGRRFSMSQDCRPLHGLGPDKNWTFTDINGHDHFYEDGYPTLKEVKKIHYFGDDESYE